MTVLLPRLNSPAIGIEKDLFSTLPISFSIGGIDLWRRSWLKRFLSRFEFLIRKTIIFSAVIVKVLELQFLMV